MLRLFQAEILQSQRVGLEVPLREGLLDLMEVPMGQMVDRLGRQEDRSALRLFSRMKSVKERLLRVKVQP